MAVVASLFGDGQAHGAHGQVEVVQWHEVVATAIWAASVPTRT